MIVPVWIVGGLGIFFYKQISCFSIPATNTFEGNINLFIVLIFGVFYIYAGSEKMQKISSQFYIIILTIIFIYILFVEILIFKNIIFKSKWYKEIKIWVWIFFYFLTIGSVSLYMTHFENFGLITWLSLSLIYAILILLISLFRKKKNPNIAYYLSIISLINILATVVIEFSLKNVCVIEEISPERIIYPVLTVILVILIRIFKLITTNENLQMRKDSSHSLKQVILETQQ